MKPVKEAKKYAKMLISVMGVDEMPKALSDLLVVETLMGRSREFRNLLLSPGFTSAEKEAVLQEVALKIGISEKVMKFLRHIIEIRVIGALPEINKIATALYLEKKRRARATVMTPIELDKGREERLKGALKTLIDRDVDIEFVMDPSLLGGILVKVGSTMYDSSIKGQLRLLKDELIKG